jgi:hypothetical protein
MNTHRPALHLTEKAVLLTLFMIDAGFVGFMLFFVGLYLVQTTKDLRLPLPAAAHSVGAHAPAAEQCPLRELRGREMERTRCR